MSKTAVALAEAAAGAKVRSDPPVLQRTAARAWRSRWLTMLSVAVQDALAATLVDEGLTMLDADDSKPPLSVEVWLDGRSAAAVSKAREVGAAQEEDKTAAAATPVAAAAAVAAAAPTGGAHPAAEAEAEEEEAAAAAAERPLRGGRGSEREAS